MKKNDTFLIYGLVTGIVTVLVQLCLVQAGMNLKTGFSFLPDVPFLIGIIMNAMAYSKANDGYVTYGNVFASCFKAALIVAVFTVSFIIFQTVMHPEAKEKALALAKEKLERQGKPDDQIELGISIARKIYLVALIGGTLIGTLFFGAIFALIGGAIAKKKGPQPFVPDNIQ